MEIDNGLKAGLLLSLRLNSLYVNPAQRTGVSAGHGSFSASEYVSAATFSAPSLSSCWVTLQKLRTASHYLRNHCHINTATCLAGWSSSKSTTKLPFSLSHMQEQKGDEGDSCCKHRVLACWVVCFMFIKCTRCIRRLFRRR